MGSSIIFLLVIAIWAVFLLPDLQTRRHQLAEARTATRMLGASRVLRRAGNDEAPREDAVEPRRSPDAKRLSAQTPPSQRPTEFIDMRAVLASHSVDHVIPARSHRVTAATTGSTSIASLDEEYVDDALAHPPVLEEHEEPAPVDDAAPVAEPPRPDPGPQPRRRPSAAGRGPTLALAALLLVSTVALPVTLLLSVLSVLPWVSVLVALVLAAGSVAGLRALATRRRVSGRQRRAAVTPPAADPEPAPVRTPVQDPSPQDVAAPTADEEPEPAPAGPLFDQNVEVHDPEPARPEVQRSSQPHHGPTAAPSSPQLRVDDRPRQWAPRTVPRPTYLMKPRAPEGRLAAPNIGATGPGHADPFGDLLDGDDDIDLGLPQSRAV